MANTFREHMIKEMRLPAYSGCRVGEQQESSCRESFEINGRRLTPDKIFGSAERYYEQSNGYIELAELRKIHGEDLCAVFEKPGEDRVRVNSTCEEGLTRVLIEDLNK